MLAPKQAGTVTLTCKTEASIHDPKSFTYTARAEQSSSLYSFSLLINKHPGADTHTGVGQVAKPWSEAVRCAAIAHNMATWKLWCEVSPIYRMYPGPNAQECRTVDCLSVNGNTQRRNTQRSTLQA